MTQRAIAMPFQREGVRAIERFGGRVLLADEQGLGKTLQALWVLKRNPGWVPAVVVCPGVAKYHWEREIAANLGWRATVCEGQKPPARGPMHTPSIIIINYEILDYWLDYLTNLGPRTVIFDECQYMTNRRTIRTDAGRALARQCPQVMALSGTPLTNRPKELWPVLNMLWPASFPSFTKFGHQYCKPQYRPWGWVYDGAENLGELHSRLKEIGMVRRLKRDVLSELPMKERTVVPVAISNPEEYDEANNDFLKWLRRAFGAGRASRAKKAERMLRMGYMKRLAAKLKCRAVVEWANAYMDEDEKLVLFGYHQPMIRALHRRLRHKSVVIDGNTTGRDRDMMRRQFQSDPRVRCLIGSTSAITALTLTAARTVAFSELYWRPGDHSQAEDRVHRIGQTEVARAIYLVAAGTIEEHLCKVIQTKQSVITETLDGGAADDLAIYDQLTERLLQ